MRIVITGATGNVGTALLHVLAEQEAGRHQVVGISRRPPPAAPPYDQAEWLSADLATPESVEVLTEACTGADAVVHLAWLIQPSYDRELLRRTNQGGTARVIEAVRRAGVAHLVHFSSVGTYSAAQTAQPVAEDYPHDGVPSSPYSVDKAAAEELLDRFEAEPAEPGAAATTVTRMRPGLILQAAAASEISRYFLPRPVPTTLLHPAMLRLVPFPAGIAVQFVHARDVARAVLLVLRERAGGAFNVAAEPVVDRQSWRAMFGGVAPPIPIPVLRGLVHSSWAAHLQPVDPGWIDLAASVPVLDTSRIRDLGWQPERTAEQVLREFLQALRDGRGTASPALAPRARLSRLLPGSNRPRERG
ncbi:MAG TPA: NAD-dependent epimerase/dehydratase family protein [Jatrophihabitans sp.]|nr:NAD-dependent epimerase/dehydratase family protein [Jatrophihabitans sp.]